LSRASCSISAAIFWSTGGRPERSPRWREYSAATGYAADRRPYDKVMGRLRVREVLARVKAVWDAARGSEPRFLGPRIPIEGDGRVSWGPSGPPPKRDARAVPRRA